ncbi:MAG: CTP synthase [Candidatus Hodarchaeales archaeon]
MKLIFVTGGVMSAVGKGITTASVAKILQFRGLNCDIIKIDPYLNIDPGTMRPQEHGEVFVTEEVWQFEPTRGQVYQISETDQDIGTYERFLGKNLHPRNNITSGQIFLSVLLRERFGEYLGHTVQIIPHITDEIKRRISEMETSFVDVLLVEVGGTVGDLESGAFLEAIRQIRLEKPPEDVTVVHVTFLPRTIMGDLKTKPSQHSVKTLLSMGIQPDFIVARSPQLLDEFTRKKLSLFCNVPEERVIGNPNLQSIYELPLILENQTLGELLCKALKIPIKKKRRLEAEWEQIVQGFKEEKGPVIRVALGGKYTEIEDSYVSINEALKHSAAQLMVPLVIEWLDGREIEKNPDMVSKLANYHGLLLTPGFGEKGTEGMIDMARYSILHNLPFLGICYGAQFGIIAFAREIMKWDSAHTTEIDPQTEWPIVDLLPEQRKVIKKGGTMRLGSHLIHINPKTRLAEIYGNQTTVHERFRHRFHFNNELVEQMEQKGVAISSTDENRNIINSLELRDHPFFVGVQFHPEYKSRPGNPAPIYTAFLRACKRRAEKIST